MSRPKTVTGRAIGTRVPDPVYEAVERARGDLERSVWIRGLILAELEAKGLAPGEAAPPPKKRGRPPKAPQAPVRGQKPKIGPPAPKAVPPPPPPPARALRTHRPGAPVFQEPDGAVIVGDAPPAPAATRKRCNHPGTRLIGGFCPQCDHVIEPGGYWREES